MEVLLIILAVLIVFDIAAYLGGADSRERLGRSEWDWLQGRK
jgi:hypothetical protein